MSGNVDIDGIVYVDGDYEKNGGGGTKNIDGGIIVKGNITLNGSIDIVYNENYMTALQNYILEEGSFNVTSWEEK